MLAVCGAALRWGGRPERRTAGLVGLAWIANLLAQRLAGEVAPVRLVAAMDGAVFLLLLALSWAERRGWMIAALACQGLALAIHAIRLSAPAMSTWTYVTALTVVSYGLLAALASGTWAAARERRAAAGPDFSS